MVQQTCFLFTGVDSVLSPVTSLLPDGLPVLFVTSVFCELTECRWQHAFAAAERVGMEWKFLGVVGDEREAGRKTELN